MSRVSDGIPDVVFRNSNEVYGDGTVALLATMSPERFEEYRAGYRCMRCHAAQDEAFPEVCKERYRDVPHPSDCRCGVCGCGFPMRAEQLRRIEHEHKGEETLWPDRSPDWEYEEWHARRGIWLPGDAT